MTDESTLFRPLVLPCGAVLKNRVAKSAMSDALGDGEGRPTQSQIRLYETWASGGVGLSIIGEVQVSPSHPEAPGNLVLLDDEDRLSRLRRLADAGAAYGTMLWPQLGHAGAMADPIAAQAAGPSRLEAKGISAREMTVAEIERLPQMYAQAAKLAVSAGFAGVQIHAAHGFLLSQFLSPLFNRRRDAVGGPIENSMKPLVRIIEAVRRALGPTAPIAVKINATDGLEGGLEEGEALEVITALDAISIDLIEISGGTYFPGAKAISRDTGRGGAYFSAFAESARTRTGKPLMLTGGFKTLKQAEAAVSDGLADVVGLARGLVLEPRLPSHWRNGERETIELPRFDESPDGGITAWYARRIEEIGAGLAQNRSESPASALAAYKERDAAKRAIWSARFANRS